MYRNKIKNQKKKAKENNSFGWTYPYSFYPFSYTAFFLGIILGLLPLIILIILIFNKGQ